MQKEQFCEKIREHESAMYAVAFSILQNETDAAEAMSEAICRAYEKLHTLRNEHAFKTWILRIVHNAAVEQIRKNAKYISCDTLPQQEAPEPVELTTKLTLRQAVEQIPQPYRTVLVLYYYESLPVSQISKITDTKEANVRKQLSRARQMLKSMLKEDFLE